MEDIFVSNGLLDGLYDAASFDKKLKIIHRALKQHLDAIDRISVILYDARMEILTTFIHSGPQPPETDGQHSCSYPADITSGADRWTSGIPHGRLPITSLAGPGLADNHEVIW